MTALSPSFFIQPQTRGRVAGATLLASVLLGVTAVPLAAQTSASANGEPAANQSEDRGAAEIKGRGADHSVSTPDPKNNDQPDRPDEPDDDMPVISPDDSGIGDMVLDGPSEPAAAESSWESVDRPAMSFAPAGAPPTASQADASAVHGRVPVADTTVSPVVVELFTSQGCSSCPPADALLGEMTSRPDVLALTYNVDYWDYLGWADDFARPEFTARQQAYGRRTGERAVYTPQFVVDGTDTALDLGPASLEMLVATHQAEGSPVKLTVKNEGNRIRVDLAPGTAMTGASSVDLVRFVPRREVQIEGGENRGRTVVYRNVVVSIERLAVWDGRAPLRLTVVPRGGSAEALPSDTRHAVLVQQIAARRSLGQIIAAVPFD